MTCMLFFFALLKKRPLRLLLIALCSFGCFFCKLGLGIAADTLVYANDKLIQLCGVGDIELYSETVSCGELEKLLLSLGASEVSEGFRYSLRCSFDDGVERTVRFIALSGDVLKPYIKGDGEFALSYGYSADFNDTLVRKFYLPNGNQIDVSAKAYMPGLNAVYADRLTPSTDGDIVDIVTTTTSLERISGEKGTNFAAALFPENVSLETVMKLIEQNDRGIEVEYVQLYENGAAYAASQSLLETVLSVSEIFPKVLFAVGFVFICVFLSGTTYRMKNALSLMMTDGTGNFTILSMLSVTGMIAMLAGFLFSVPCALLLAEDIGGITAENMGIPLWGLEIHICNILLPIAQCMLIAFLAALVSVAFLKFRSIADIRRSVTRRKTAAIMDIAVTALCSGAAMCLVAVTLFFGDSLLAVRNELIEQRCDYDVQIVYSSLVPETELSKLEALDLTEKCEGVVIGSAILKHGEKKLHVNGVGLESSDSLLRFYSPNGEEVNAMEGKLVLAESTAQRLGVKTDDIIELQAFYGGKDITVRCLVGALVGEYSSFMQIAPIETVRQYLDSSGVMNSALVKLKGSSDDFVLYASKLPDVYTVQTKDGAKIRFDSRFEGTLRLTKFIIADGILLGLSVCLLTGYSAWRRNLQRIRVLMLLGESGLKLALKDAILRFTGMVAGLLAAIPTSTAIAKWLFGILSNDSITYPVIIDDKSLFTAAGLTVLYAVASMMLYCSLCKKYTRLRV